MNVESVQEALHKQPFQPFSLRMADGRTFLVAHPDFVAVSPTHAVVISPTDESIASLEARLIVSIEYFGTTQRTAAVEDKAM